MPTTHRAEAPNFGGANALRLEETAKSAVVMILGRLLKQITGLIIEVLLVRWLAPEVWEATARFLTLSLTATVVLQFGFPESLLTLGSQSQTDRDAQRMLLRVSAILTFLAGLFTIALYPFSALRERTLGSADLGVLSFFCAFLSAELVASAVPSFLVGRRLVRPAAVYSVVARIPPILCALSALSLGGHLLHVVAGLSVGSTLSALLGLLFTERLTRHAMPSASAPSFLEQLRYAAPVGLARLTQMANSQLDKLIVLGALQEASYGSYYLGAVEMPFIPMLCQTVTSVLMPELLRAKREGTFLALFHLTVQKLSLLALPAFAFLFAFADRIVETIYGPGHALAVTPFRIFQTLLLHRFTNYALLFQALSVPEVSLYASLLMLGLNLPLGIMLVKFWGPPGAAAATVLSLYLSTVYTFIALKQKLDVRWSQLLPWRAYGKTLGVALAALLPASYVGFRLRPDLPSLVVMVALYLFTYLLLGSDAGVISDGDTRFLRDLARLAFLRAAPRTEAGDVPPERTSSLDRDQHKPIPE